MILQTSLSFIVVYIPSSRITKSSRVLVLAFKSPVRHTGISNLVFRFNNITTQYIENVFIVDCVHPVFGSTMGRFACVWIQKLRYCALYWFGKVHFRIGGYLKQFISLVYRSLGLSSCIGVGPGLGLISLHSVSNSRKVDEPLM